MVIRFTPADKMPYKLEPNYDPSKAEEWKQEYEEGSSILDIAIKNKTSKEFVRKILVGLGVAIRTDRKLRLKKRKSHIGPAFDEQHND